MKKIIFIFFVTLCSIGSVWADEYEDALDRIDKAISAEEWQLADSLIITTVKGAPGNPTNPLLLSNLGMIRFYAGRDSAAIEALNQAHDLAPVSVTILANRARVYTAIGRPTDAVHDYNTIEQLDSTYSDTYLYRGLIFLYNGYFEAAEADLTRLEKMAPDSEDTAVALASLYSITSRPDKAIPHFSQLIRSTPKAEYYAGRAMCHLSLDNLLDAADDIASGLELDSQYSELYLARAILNKKRYANDDSLRDADTALRLGADPARVKTLLNL